MLLESPFKMWDHSFKEVCPECGKEEFGINTYIHYHRICENCNNKEKNKK